MRKFYPIKYTYQIGEAITPLDGRNRHKLTSLIPYFSDFALNRYRFLIECHYLEKLALAGLIRKITKKEKEILKKIISSFFVKDYQRLREIEFKNNHEVKAVEELLKEKLNKTSLADLSPMVHFCLTSDDINNLSYGLMVKDALEKVILPEIAKIKQILKENAKKYRNLTMLGRTHGQIAVPTTLGKEFLVFYTRLNQEFEILKNSKIKGKLTGNVGNFNAYQFLFPEVDWLKFSQEFVSELGLEPDLITTQIQPYDSLIRVFQTLLRINNLLTGLCLDIWLYLSLGYFKQKVIKREIGSTALPHKVNPIYFEGAEGGFGVANALFEFYCRKLSYSRLQRDLSDSTVRRSFGIAFSYCLLSYQSLIEGLSRIKPDREKILGELNNHWEVLSEAIQNFLRIKGYYHAYEKVKNFFRGKEIRREEFKKFIESLKLSKKEKESLLRLKPERYTGYAGKLVDMNT